jgi:signal transduction histidine kinase
MPQQPAETSGMGLKIMRHRARLIHATLDLGPAQGGGTLVTCSVIKGNDNDQ